MDGVTGRSVAGSDVVVGVVGVVVVVIVVKSDNSDWQDGQGSEGSEGRGPLQEPVVITSRQ